MNEINLEYKNKYLKYKKKYLSLKNGIGGSREWKSSCHNFKNAVNCNDGKAGRLMNKHDCLWDEYNKTNKCVRDKNQDLTRRDGESDNDCSSQKNHQSSHMAMCLLGLFLSALLFRG